MSEKVEKLEKRIRELQARKQRLLARERAEERKRRTRGLILIASHLLATHPKGLRKIILGQINTLERAKLEADTEAKRKRIERDVAAIRAAAAKILDENETGSSA